jgi:hypothetical protein
VRHLSGRKLRIYLLVPVYTAFLSDPATFEEQTNRATRTVVITDCPQARVEINTHEASLYDLLGRAVPRTIHLSAISTLVLTLPSSTSSHLQYKYIPRVVASIEGACAKGSLALTLALRLNDVTHASSIPRMDLASASVGSTPAALLFQVPRGGQLRYRPIDWQLCQKVCWI